MKLDASLARKTAAWRNLLRLAEPLQQMLRSRRSPRRLHVAKAHHQPVGLDRARRQAC